jgi:ribosome-associated protein
MTTSTRTEASAKKDVTKLQRAIVDGLEDVKAQDIQVFNTEKLSPLFERVIVASGTSNRQTKALASSVRDALREAGFAKPRTEGEDNGEWIIVDCGPAVVHIMQPAIRQYYHLEELWGGTPVRLKLGAAKPVVTKAEPKPAAKKVAKPKAPAKTLTPAEAKKAAKARREAEKPIAPQRPVLSPEAPILSVPDKPSRRSVARKTAAAKTTSAPVKAAAKAPAKKAVVKTVVVKPIAKKPAAKKAPARKPAAKKA